jgi:hypothetical protein
MNTDAHGESPPVALGAYFGGLGVVRALARRSITVVALGDETP